MFEYLTGILAQIYPTYVVLDVHGVGYKINMANPFSFQDRLKKEVQLFIYQSVKEDDIQLYGFKNLDDKMLFLKLISVSGIGPKSALSILATQDNAGLVQAIENSNATYLMKFPGVGKKTASQMILDLQGKLSFETDIASEQKLGNLAPTDTHMMIEVKDALIGLGYSEKEIKKILPKLKNESFQTSAEALSLAFKLLLN